MTVGTRPDIRVGGTYALDEPAATRTTNNGQPFEARKRYSTGWNTALDPARHVVVY